MVARQGGQVIFYLSSSFQEAEDGFEHADPLPDDVPAEKVDKGPFNGSPSHGMGVAPDGKTLWVTSRPNARVYVYSLPDVKLLGYEELGGRPDWLTITPDSKTVYISTGNTDTTTAIDVATRKKVGSIPVGNAPKLGITLLGMGVKRAKRCFSSEKPKT